MLDHAPVLLGEVLEGLNVQPEGRYLDGTFGRGGHTAAILGRLGARGQVIAFDRDPDAVRAGRERFGGERRLNLLRARFAEFIDSLAVAGIESRFNGLLLDLGVSSPQLGDPARGFSFMQDGPLDMRMDNESGFAAADWLNRAPEHEIQRVIREYGEEKFARRIARAIVTARQGRALSRTSELATIVAESVPTREPGKHPATRTFQAIRMYVNGELEELDAALRQSLQLLQPGGRLCVISFHSLEDQRVKQFIQRQSQDDPVYAGLPHIPAEARARMRRIGRAIHPTPAEVAMNPRARSAILRIAERLAA